MGVQHFPAYFWPYYKFMHISVETLEIFLTLVLTTSYSAGRLMGERVSGGHLGIWG